MTCWWVNQGQSYKAERAGSFLWAPQSGEQTRGERVVRYSRYYWTNMESVRPGDAIYSYVDGAFVALSIAKSSAYEAENPHGAKSTWDKVGRRIDVAYTDLEEPIKLSAVVEELMEIFATVTTRTDTPLDEHGKPKVGYLFDMGPFAGEVLATAIGITHVDAAIDATLTLPPAPLGGETERAAPGGKVRTTQAEFRRSLDNAWSERCCVTGLGVREMLRASHIKPWRACNHAERQDPANGLLLSVAYDAAFDSNLISFDDDGTILLAPRFAPFALDAGIDPKARIRRELTPGHREYLAIHRAGLGLSRRRPLA